MQTKFEDYFQRYFKDDINYLANEVEEVFEEIPTEWNFSKGLKARIKQFISNQDRLDRIENDIREFLPYLKA